jgi:indole-3-glycerol phosphate synthase
MQGRDESFISTLVKAAEKTISEGYYNIKEGRLSHASLVDSILSCKDIPVIAEVKFRSPAQGQLREEGDVAAIARAYERGGARGISVLTEPKHFLGSLQYLKKVKESVAIPVLMKDIVIDPVQLEAAQAVGADAVLLIASIFGSNLGRHSLGKLIDHAHARNLEVLLEVHTDEEYGLALESAADLVGINNRDLSTLRVSLDVSKRLLKGRRKTKPVICESGFSERKEMEQLRSLGADGFLVGSALMKATDIEAAVRALTGVTD